MNIRYHLQKILLVMVATAMVTSAIICDKLIDDNASLGNTRDKIMDAGRYMVNTTGSTKSQQVQLLIDRLNGARDIRYTDDSFTAVLEPKDLKKLCKNKLVKSIEMIEQMNNTHNCEKLISGEPGFVVPSSYIVVIKQFSSMSEIMPIITAATDDLDNSMMITGINEFQNLHHRGAIMRMNSDAVNFMCQQSMVDYIEEDQIVEMTSSTTQWHLDRIDQSDLPLDGQYSTINNGSGIDIYIFDTGIRFDHEEFEGRAKYDLFDPLDVLTGSNQQGRDCQGHGTHVAALAAGKTFGAAKGATLYSTRVLACNGKASYGPVLLGIDHVIQRQIARRDKKVIINMSLGGPISFLLHEAIRQATEEGILVVVAAGNDIDDACSFSPGSSPDVLTVGGTRWNDDLYLRLFDGTNYGRCVDVFAPGQDITSAGLSRPDAVATFSGTSQATPLVSGAAAIYWSINKIAAPLEVKDAIISTCTRDKLNIDAVVPPSYQGQSPNCLLNINPHQMFGQSEKKENSTHKVFTSVPSADLHSLIADMEYKSFALTYIHSHTSDSSYHYSLIFKYMADVEFQTLMFAKARQLRKAQTQFEASRYQLVLLYDMDTIDYIAVIQKTNISYTQLYRVNHRRHKNFYQSKSAQNFTLLSTTVGMTNKGNLRYSSVYRHDGQPTRHFSSVSYDQLLTTINEQFNEGFYLAHLATVPTALHDTSLVFHQMTKSQASYIFIVDVGLEQVEQVVQAQLARQAVPLVVAGFNTADGVKFVISFEL
ncbi:uncharacterized protein [Dysidea avara]|uniref:uncharacterized protein n=1 Tax=Dysidea avara TaxID=196820 RepID=UPI003320E658